MRDFKTIDEQIQLLKSRNLIFLNEETARLNLLRYGYYEIINGYKDFILKNKNPDEYKKGETFEHMFELYKLDKSLKNTILKSTLDFELNLKTVLSYVLSKKYGVLNNSYLNRQFYNLGKRDKKGKYQLDRLFTKFDYIINDNIEPFKHYRLDHGHTPPWILFKGCTFGNIKHFYNLQKSNVKDEVIAIMMGFPIELVEEFPSIKNFFSDFLNLAYNFRNRAAHSGRVYNYNPKNSSVRYFNIFHKNEYVNIDEAEYRLGYGKNDIYTLNKAFILLENMDPSYELSSGLNTYVTSHLEKYPDDKNFLLTSMGVPKRVIESKEVDFYF